MQLVYGLPVDNGFYYDMWLPEGERISSDDFERIEKEMKSIIDEKRAFTRYEMSADEGMRKVESEGSKYKIDNARRAIEAGSDSLSWYATGEPGEDWEDLCRGPHVPSTGRIGRGEGDEHRRQLLAWRLHVRQSDAGVRHGVHRQETAQATSESAGGGSQAGPSSHRQAA